MRQRGFPLRAIMIVIAILAILMGLAAARRIDHQSDLLEKINIPESDWAMGVTESWRVWIKVSGPFSGKLTGFFISPITVGSGAHGKQGTSEFYLLPPEYVVILFIGLATTTTMLADYWHRRRRRSSSTRE